jgi:hypothetical protein
MPRALQIRLKAGIEFDILLFRNSRKEAFGGAIFIEIPMMVQITRNHRVLVPTMFGRMGWSRCTALALTRWQRRLVAACAGDDAVALAGWDVKCAGKHAWCVR